MSINFLIAALAALVPLVMGFIWYNPKVFGSAWMSSLGFSDEDLKGVNMPKVFIISYLLSFMVAVTLHMLVIHQWGLFSSLMGEPGFKEGTGEAATYFNQFMETYGNRFRTFKHGSLHGAMTGVFLALPVIGINAMFERRNWKNIWINVGYWVVTLAIMGGIICQWA